MVVQDEDGGWAWLGVGDGGRGFRTEQREHLGRFKAET